MLVFWKERLVLLAVPKTGTQAYEEALRDRASMAILDPPELKHAPLYRYNRFFRPMFEKVGGDEMEIAAVIREPISWLGSWYRYRQRPFLDRQPVSTQGMSFDSFVRAYCSETPPACANVGAQSKFVEPRPNGVKVTHLFSYEHRDRLDAFLADRLGVAVHTERRNVSPVGDCTLSKATEALLRRTHAAEFALWERVAAEPGPGKD